MQRRCRMAHSTGAPNAGNPPSPWGRGLGGGVCGGWYLAGSGHPCDGKRPLPWPLPQGEGDSVGALFAEESRRECRVPARPRPPRPPTAPLLFPRTEQSDDPGTRATSKGLFRVGSGPRIAPAGASGAARIEARAGLCCPPGGVSQTIPREGDSVGGSGHSGGFSAIWGAPVQIGNGSGKPDNPLFFRPILQKADSERPGGCTRTIILPLRNLRHIRPDAPGCRRPRKRCGARRCAQGRKASAGPFRHFF